MLKTGDLLDEHLILHEVIGEGGMGVVFRAVNIRDGHPCAVKICTAADEESRRRFAREVRFMLEISHRNVIPILGSNLDFVPPYLVMPLAKESLAQSLHMPLDEDVAIDAMLQICEGIQAIHSAQGTHRDIKPDNVLRLEDGRLVVSDLGLIKIEPRDTTVLTQTARFLGTRIYCAPEQLVPGGSREADARTDVYLLGKTFYHLLTGEIPALVDPNRLPTGLAIIVQRATRELPSERFQSVGHLVDAINSYIRAKAPGASASSVFDGELREAVERQKIGEYRTENLSALLDALMQFAGDSAIFLEQMDRVPDKVLHVLAGALPEKLSDVLEQYEQALESVVRQRAFEYAEHVAARMKVIRSNASLAKLRARALVAVLIAAVRLNRFAAMSAFDAMLIETRASDEAAAVNDLLRVHFDDYKLLAARVPRAQLHAGLYAIRDEAERYNS